MLRRASWQATCVTTAHGSLLKVSPPQSETAKDHPKRRFPPLRHPPAPRLLPSARLCATAYGLATEVGPDRLRMDLQAWAAIGPPALAGPGPVAAAAGRHSAFSWHTIGVRMSYARCIRNLAGISGPRVAKIASCCGAGNLRQAVVICGPSWLTPPSYLACLCQAACGPYATDRRMEAPQGATEHW